LHSQLSYNYVNSSNGKPAPTVQTPLCRKASALGGIIAQLSFLFLDIDDLEKVIFDSCPFRFYFLCGTRRLRNAPPGLISSLDMLQRGRGRNIFPPVSVGATFHFSHSQFLLAHIPLHMAGDCPKSGPRMIPAPLSLVGRCQSDQSMRPPASRKSLAQVS